jgi:hypothetical protein
MFIILKHRINDEEIFNCIELPPTHLKKPKIIYSGR